MRLPPLAIAVGIVAAALLLTRRAQASNLPAYTGGGVDAWASDDIGFDSGLAPVISEPWASDDIGFDFPLLDEPDTQADPFDYFNPGGSFVPVTFPGGPTDRLIDGMLFAIRTAEVGRVPDAERYFYGYGFKRFNDLSDHPIITGELSPVRLPDRFCAAVGLSPGCVSTAAGAYQFIRPTWNRLRAAGRWGPRLPDFSPASQDEAARRLLRESGITSLLERGDIEGAIRRAGTQWASLPGSTAKQGGITMARALQLVAQGSQASSGVIV